MTLSQSFTTATFVAFDTETTGREATRARMVELGAVRWTGLDGEPETFAQLVRPDTPIPRESTLTHGIREEDVRASPGAAAALERFASWLGQGSSPILMAHNASFDIDIVSHESARAGLSVPQAPILDTLTMARRILPGLPSYSLESLSRGLSLPTGQLHRALDDARLTMGLFCACARRLLEQGHETLEAGLEWLGQPLAFREAGPFPAGSEEVVETIRQALTERSELALEVNRGAGNTVSQKVRPLAVYPAPAIHTISGGPPGAYLDVTGATEEGVVQLPLERVVAARLVSGGQQLLFG